MMAPHFLARVPPLPPPFLPAMIRPVEGSSLTSSTPVPVSASTGQLPLALLRRFFPAATGLHYRSPEGWTVSVHKAKLPNGEVIFLLPDPNLEYVVSSYSWQSQQALQGDPCQAARMVEDSSSGVVTEVEARVLSEEVEKVKGLLEKGVKNVDNVRKYMEELQIQVMEVEKLEGIQREVKELSILINKVSLGMTKDLTSLRSDVSTIKREMCEITSDVIKVQGVVNQTDTKKDHMEGEEGLEGAIGEELSVVQDMVKLPGNKEDGWLKSISKFQTVTGSDEARAREILELMGWNLERALDWYLKGAVTNFPSRPTEEPDQKDSEKPQLKDSLEQCGNSEELGMKVEPRKEEAFGWEYLRPQDLGDEARQIEEAVEKSYQEQRKCQELLPSMKEIYQRLTVWYSDVHPATLFQLSVKLEGRSWAECEAFMEKRYYIPTEEDCVTLYEENEQVNSPVKTCQEKNQVESPVQKTGENQSPVKNTAQQKEEVKGPVKVLQKKEDAKNPVKVFRKKEELQPSDEIVQEMKKTKAPVKDSGKVGEVREHAKMDEIKAPDASDNATLDSNSFHVGQYCQARWKKDQTWYNAKVLEVLADGVTVKFSNYGNKATVGKDEVVWSPADIPEGEAVDSHVATASQDKEFYLGRHCQARWREDQVWYNAEILAVQGDSVTVSFTDYGNEAVVGREEVVWTPLAIPEGELVDSNVVEAAEGRADVKEVNQEDKEAKIVIPDQTGSVDKKIVDIDIGDAKEEVVNQRSREEDLPFQMDFPSIRPRLVKKIR